VYAWDIEKREQRCCFECHTDIVMDVLNLDCLDSIVSASLDKKIIVVDSYTEQETARLIGHTKGVNSLCYNAQNRFLISTGFDHDVFVWSPFVSTLLNKLKGHRAVRWTQSEKSVDFLFVSDEVPSFLFFQCVV
jgi:WD40 repeat protein